MKKKFSSWLSSEEKPTQAPAAVKKEVFDAYAADLPVAYKAPPPKPAALTFWGEGGAIWTGGDPVSRDFNLFTIGSLGSLLGIGGVPAHFQQDPKIGWEAAAGFDYKFANSPWHVSGQFRYGQGGDVNNAAAVAGVFPFAIPARFGITSITSNEAVTDKYRETHWIADGAVGYEIASSGRSYLQLKGGLRVGEMTTKDNSTDAFGIAINFRNPLPAPLSGNQIAINTFDNNENRANFLGAGPLVGMQGSVRFMQRWSFDYAGDMAILFGSAHNQNVDIFTTSAVPAFLNAFFSGGTANTNTADRFAYVLSADLQAGIGYWFTENWKLAGSWRIDSMINVQNTRNANNNPITPSRYWQGPRVTLTGLFAAE